MGPGNVDDRPLTREVNELGELLGNVIREQGGDALFERVETIRLSAKLARESQDAGEQEAARKRIADACASLSPTQALDVTRAFTLYFRLVNAAEDVHATRMLRKQEIEGGVEAVNESLAQVVGELAAAGVDRDTVMRALSEIHIRHVFTAHPTEARRRTTERLLRDVRLVLEARDRSAQTPTETRALNRRLRAAVEAAWQHSSERNRKPEVFEEVKAGLWYFETVLFDAVPKVQRRIARAIELHFGPCDPADVPVVLDFGSWMGSDRDGNPFVNEKVTERTLDLQRRLVLNRYIRDLDELVDPLAADEERIGATASLDRALQNAGNALPGLVHRAHGRNPREPFRRLITFMRERLVRAREFSDGAYQDPKEFLDDLLAIRDGLTESGAVALPRDGLLDLILRVRTFGFVLAPLDVREDSGVHHRAVAELLRDPTYVSASPEKRTKALDGMRLPSRGAEISPETRRQLDLMESIVRFKERHGPKSVSTYIISMAEAAADVMEVLKLAELYGIDTELDIVPLFETRKALLNAESLLEEMFANPVYREHLVRRGNVQEVILGYSDSMKESGILASRVSVLDAQLAAAEVCRKHGLTLRVFHGRGGSVSRGGGPTHRAIRALPKSIFSGHVKITEQGETRSFHFANPDLAARYLEQTLGAALVVRCGTDNASSAATPETDMPALRTLAQQSHDEYRNLVEDDGLIEYFTSITPLEQITQLNIASRPAKRRGAVGLKDLRAIPWVFAWSQCRHVITGWYGVGSALQKGDGKLVRDLYQRNAFFRDLLDNVQMTLAKSDMSIGQRYSELCATQDVRERMFGKVKNEFDRTMNVTLSTRGVAQLLDDDPRIQTSIRLRNPYVDSLSYLQIEALKRIASSDDENKALWQRVCRHTIKGVSAGLRNTG